MGLTGSDNWSSASLCLGEADHEALTSTADLTAKRGLDCQSLSAQLPPANAEKQSQLHPVGALDQFQA